MKAPMVLVLVLAANVASAQTATGVIDGEIRDPAREPVPGVTVVANSPALIQKNLTVVSNEAGYYRLPVLPPGTYVVTYTLQGFQAIERGGLIVNAGQTTSIDIELKLAAVEESVTVLGESPAVDPTSTELGFNYTKSLLENVPTRRDFNAMAATVPGVESASNFGDNQPGSNEFQNVLGAGSRANFYTFDGTNATDPAVQSNQTSLFSYDIIEEVQVIKGGKPAEVGFAQGGFFQIITKSGGNAFHGESSLYYQDDALQSSNISERLRQANVTTSNRLINAYDVSASLGGRIVRDKLWWYGSARRQVQKLTLLGFAETLEDTINAYFWKNTYQLGPNHRFSGGINHWDDYTNYFFFGFAPALAADPNASMIAPRGGEAANIRWTGVLTPNVIADAGFGFSKLRLDQRHQPSAGVAIRDSVTGMRFRNPGGSSRDHDSDNLDMSGSLAWFVPDAAGRHDIKFGVQNTHSPFSWGLEEIQDHRLVLANGAPSQVNILNTPLHAKWVQNYTSAYGQDSWSLGDRLTLNFGVRYDRIHSFTAHQTNGDGQWTNTSLAARFPELTPQTFEPSELLTWNSVAPRLAASWKLDPHTVFKASASRYYHYLQAQQLISANPAGMVTFTFQWTDLNGDREYQIGEEGRLISRSGGRTNTVDPTIRHPYTDELIVGASREMFTDFSLNANFIYRRDERLTNQLNLAVPFSAYSPIQIVDPGEDGIVGSGDDGRLTVYAQDPATLGLSQRQLTNPPGNTRLYRGLELIANKRLSNKWQFVGSFVISRMEVTQTTNDSGASGQFENPNALIYARGRDPLTATYQLKLQGTYSAPYGLVLSGFYTFNSGLPFTRDLVVLGLPQGPTTVFAEPRGSRETDNPNNVDFRVEKTLNLAGGSRLGLILDVFNLGNASTVTQYGNRTSVDLGAPRAVRNPRIARFGVRLIW